MTLRVTIEIVPFGVEADKRVIETINISNIGYKMDPQFCTYIVEHNEYKAGKGPLIVHKRALGAIELARHALDELLTQKEETIDQPDID